VHNKLETKKGLVEKCGTEDRHRQKGKRGRLHRKTPVTFPLSLKNALTPRSSCRGVGRGTNWGTEQGEKTGGREDWYLG